jgi:hypothetical protein
MLCSSSEGFCREGLLGAILFMDGPLILAGCDGLMLWSGDDFGVPKLALK